MARRHGAPCRGGGRRAAHAAPPASPRLSASRGRAAMAAAAAGKAAAAYGHGESGGGRGGGFLGPRVPAEVEAMARGVQDVGQETFRRLLKGRARAWPVLGTPPGLALPRRGGTGGIPRPDPTGGRRVPRGRQGQPEGACSALPRVGRAAALLGRFPSGSLSGGLNTTAGFLGCILKRCKTRENGVRTFAAVDGPRTDAERCESHSSLIPEPAAESLSGRVKVRDPTGVSITCGRK